MMHISLTPELEHFIEEKVTSGFYTSSSEVVREALQMLIDRDALKNQRIYTLNQEIDLGLAQVARGETITASALHEELMSKRRTRDQKNEG